MSSTLQTSGSTALAFVRLCPHCEKVFSKEYSYNRHVSYCRRAQTKRKGRPKSCAGCSAAKAKCSFEKPQCLRCSHKGIDCVYEQRKGHADMMSGNGGAFITEDTELGLVQPSSIGLRSGFDTSKATMDAVSLDFFHLSGVDNFMDELLQPGVTSGINTNSSSCCPNSDSFGWGLILDDSDSEQVGEEQFMTVGTHSRRPRAWEGFFPEDDVATVKWNTLTDRRLGVPVADHVANLVLHIIRSFPQMMLRRQTFPPFIHKHWHRSAIPEKLATCMSIAQLFASRTPETRPFLWRTVDAEERRMREEMENYTEHDILPAVQALIIYMIMALIDQYDGTAARGVRMIQTFQAMTIKFREMLGSACFAESEQQRPSVSWEDWVFQESRRRLANIWFVINRVITADAQLPCPDLNAYREMPLSTGKAMWEARSREEWETERAFFQASLLHTDMWKFRSLIEARRQPHSPLNAAKLDAWEAETDKMGVLMNIAVSLLDNTS